MQSLSCQEIRDKWLEYFTQKCSRKHSHTKSASLVPDNPTLLLNAAGMVQFVPIFLGSKEAPEPPRTVTIQKCVRVGGKDSDLENIGRTSRHHSFFEMLGNFSFGDYFKNEVIPWAWEFVTKELRLPKDRLFVSVFAGDDLNEFDQEAYDIWLNTLRADGLNKPETMIKRMGREDNFWGPPGSSGPCGPCSEIYFDLGKHIEDEDERYVEIWNLVFMQLDKSEDGKFTPLEKKNIDTGAGLERLATILQGVSNTFETDELFTILKAVEAAINETGKNISYKGKDAETDEDKEMDIYLKIITDHLRCLAFLISDGVRPSNLGRGYVLRMIIRRAARFVYLLTGSAEPFLCKLLPLVCETYKAAYPELLANQQSIVDVCKKEEEQFDKTIENGLSVLTDGLKQKVKEQKDGKKVLDGAFAFDLYSTYGLPLELTQEIALEQGIDIDHETYNKAKEKHSEASNTGAFKVAVLQSPEIPKIIKEFGETKFLGYDAVDTEAKVIAILDSDGNRVESIKQSDIKTIDGQPAAIQVVLDQTTFYGESGGQLGDTGIINNDAFTLNVFDTKKTEGLFIHVASLESGEIKVGDKVSVNVDPEKRRLSKTHHSNCHLLQAALKQVLGDSVEQQGSQVGPEYTRFDFNFDRGMSKEEIHKVETIINGWIQAELPVKAEEMSMEEAEKAGALAFFEEKYGDKVRVLFMGDDKTMASTELCGGIHVDNLKEIEVSKLVSEGSVAAGIRRIKMVTSDKAREFIREQAEKDRIEAEKEAAAEKAKAEAKARKKEMAKRALEKVDDLVAAVEDIAGQKAIITEVPGLDGDSLKTLVEAVKDKAEAQHGSLIIALATAQEDEDGNKKPIFVVAVSVALTKNIKAGDLAKQAAQICGGGGGGRPNLAQAGGRDTSKISEALAKVREELKTAKV